VQTRSRPGEGYRAGRAFSIEGRIAGRQDEGEEEEVVE
jgi:hypothetical protein